MKYRVLLIGTSNGVFVDGYASAFEAHPAISDFKNISLGGSTNVMLPYRLTGVNLADYDMVFIETGIHDAAAMKRGAYLESQMTAVFHWITAECKKAGALPVGIILPPQYSDLFPRTAELTRQAFGGVCLDLSTVMHEFDGAWSDPSHVSKPLAIALITAFLDEVFKLDIKDLWKYVPDAAEYSFSFVSLRENPAAQMGMIRSAPVTTRLVEDVAYCVMEGQEFHVDLDSAAMLAALVVNRFDTRCVLEITGARSIMKDMRFQIADRPGVIMNVAALSVPLEAQGNGRFTFRVQEPVLDITHMAPPDRMQITGIVVQRPTGHAASTSGEMYNSAPMVERVMRSLRHPAEV